MRAFEVEFRPTGSPWPRRTAIIALHEEVINRVDEEWRSQFYPLLTPEEIAEHIAYCLFVLDLPLSDLDGWADLDDDYVEIIQNPWLEIEWDIGVEEIPYEGR